jgi:hypothetical protein
MTVPDAPATSLPTVGRFEIPLASLGAVAAISLFFALPVLGAIGLPLAAVPLVRLAHRRGLIHGLLGCALASALVLGIAWAAGGLGSGFAMAAVCAGLTVLPTSTVGFLRAGVDSSRCYLGLCLLGCAFLGAGFAASMGRPGPTFSTEVAGALDSWIPAFVDSYAKQGADSESIARMRVALESGREFARDYLWGIFGALWIVGAAISFYFGAWAARPAATAEATRFQDLRVPAQAAALFVVSGAVFGLVPGVGRRIAGNLMLPLGALFFVAGLSIICHFLRRWLRTRILRAGLYALAVYFPINVGVALLGLFDWYVDFRRRGGEGTERS